MIERAIYTLIEAGIAQFSSRPRLFTAIFQPEGDVLRVADAELAKIKAYWATRPPIIRHGYPIPGMQVPCYSLVHTSERIEKQPLGFFAMMDEEYTDEEVIGVLEARTYSIAVYAENPDACYWLYKVLKAIILRNIRMLISYGAQRPTWTGRELAPVAEIKDTLTFVRVLQLDVAVEEYVNTDLPFVPVASVGVRREHRGGAIDEYEV